MKPSSPQLLLGVFWLLILAPAYWEANSPTEQKCLTAPLSPESVAPTLAPPSLTLKLVNLITSHLSLALFKLLPLHWNFEQVHLCVAPLRRAAPWSPAAHCPFGTQSLVFTARCYRESSSQHLWSWLGSWCGVGIPRSSAGITLLMLNHTPWVWDLPIPCFCPSCQSPRGFFFMPLVIGILFRESSESSGGSQWWFYNLDGPGRRRAQCTYSTILLRSHLFPCCLIF